MLSIHSGLGCGECHFFRVGSPHRFEFFPSGDPANQMFAAEGNAERGEAVCSSVCHGIQMGLYVSSIRIEIPRMVG